MRSAASGGRGSCWPDRLQLGGLDDQTSITSEYARAVLPGLVASMVATADAGECRAAVDRNLKWTYDQSHPLDDAEHQRLLRCVRVAAPHAATASASAAIATSDAVLLTNLASYVARRAEAKGARDRDESMFTNVSWYLKRLQANAKVIIWTANVHGSKQKGERSQKPLGAWLHDKLGDQVGVVGFTALAGNSSMAGMPTKPLEAASVNSLEARVSRPGVSEAYVDADALGALGVVESRLFGRFTLADWSSRFDGVVVVRDEQPATFEKVY